MTFVLDASVTLSWLFEDESNAFAEQALDLLSEEGALVPAVLWELEVANALALAKRKGRMPESYQLKDMTVILYTLPLTAEAPSRGFDLLDLCEQHRLTSYDATYLALALSHRCALATLDSGLKNAARTAGVALLEDRLS